MENKLSQKIDKFSSDLLCKAKKAFDQAEVYNSLSNGIFITFSNGRLKEMAIENERCAIGLRVIKNGKIGVAGGLKLKGVEDLIDQARVSVLYGPKAFLNFPGPVKKSSIENNKNFDPKIPKTSVKNVVEDAQKMIDSFKISFPKFTFENLYVGWQWSRMRVINSANLNLLKEETSSSALSTVAKRIKNDFFTIDVWQADGAWCFKSFDLLQNLLQQVNWGKKIARLPKEPLLVVFTPQAFENLVGYLLYALNGRVVNDKSSKLGDKLGKKVFDERLTLVNDPLAKLKPYSYVFDDEGIIAEKKTLIDKGVVNNFIYDLQEAARAGVKTTASGLRSSVFGNLDPSSSNLVFSNGKKSWPKILKNIKRGILIYSVIGSGQGSITNGDFSFSVQLGYLIENGEIVGRLKNVGVAGNVFKLLKNGIVDLSEDREWHGSIKAPYLVASGLKLSSM